jgi:hypothetical protein
MITATINGKKVAFPASWAEVTVNQFFNIRSIDPKKEQAQVIFEVLDILTGIPASTWYDMEANQVSTDTILGLIEFIKEPIEWEGLEVPKEVVLNGKTCKVPKDLELKTYGQAVLFESKILPVVLDKGELTDVLKTALAIYLQPIYTGEKFDGEKLEEMEEVVGALPIYTAFPVANFFFRKYLRSLVKKGLVYDEALAPKNTKPV